MSVYKIKSVEKEFEDLKKINIKAKKHIINTKNGFEVCNNFQFFYSF